MAHSSSSCTWVYDVFPSFSGEDVRVTFLSHFIKELDRKLIIAFKDNEIKKSQSLDPVLKQAIKDSRIAVVVFSINYASSTWCLNELLEIVKCKEEFSQMVIPVFYRLDPSHVRKQTGDFGNIFEKTCHNKPEEVKIQWKEALTSVANILGYHSTTWFNEAKMIEEIANDVLDKLLLTTSRDFEDFVGIEDHISEMSILLQLASKEVRMVGIWGSSGIDALVGQTHWFGCGSRIIVITKDKHFLRAHEIDHIYEVRLPSEEAALEMLCRYAFKQKYPPDGFLELASEVALRAVTMDVTIGLKNLVDKSLIHERYDIVEMHSLLQEMGKEIVRMQSNEPGEHEFLVDWKDICNVLEDNKPLTPLMEMLSPSLTRMYLSNIPTLVELPSSIQNLHKLEELSIWNCKNLETLPTGINLKSLYSLDLSGCSQMRCFPDISTNISELFLNETAIEEVPWWIENFSNLSFIICGELSEVILNNSPSSVTNNTHLPVCIKFINCFKVDHEALLMEQSVFFEFSCDEVPSYFTHQTAGASLINVPLLHISPCQPFFRFRACALVDSESIFIDSLSKFQNRLKSDQSALNLPFTIPDCNETEYSEKWKDCDDSDLSSEIEQWKDCELLQLGKWIVYDDVKGPQLEILLGSSWKRLMQGTLIKYHEFLTRN
ncbi:Toll/interleukin-1 receptor homology (TIR) domain [Arabidopsis thaliana x Arabidopsis arenosa]|uniref:Toll/interleukin-1 receptor homology (TIR) domain n=1 Tax=Arabidopsis thaliana x Arabidopsis arenosa TaxID=1240361 RepID=A0A8T1ZIN0_9BRAS|nr:Toll/interleukin-1 receptor homology (TIR) domain [Arabidopsis thaliana x Arabidopsis arenosa]